MNTATRERLLQILADIGHEIENIKLGMHDQNMLFLVGGQIQQQIHEAVRLIKKPD